MEGLLHDSGILARKHMSIIGDITNSIHTIVYIPRRMKHG